jgi:DNA-binding NarL/FixJ family response regulator
MKETILMNVKLAIADDHALFRRGLVQIIGQHPNLTFVLEATNGQELIDELEKIMPDVDLVLMDLQMPIMDGIKATELLKIKYPDLKILVLSMHDEDHFVTHLMELGANGYLLKDSDPEEVERAIFTIMKDEYYYGDFLNRVMHRRMIRKTAVREPSRFANVIVNLSEREEEVLKMICDGLTNVEIAEKIFLSPRTVDGHRIRIMDKVGVKNTAGLVVFAVKNKIY